MKQKITLATYFKLGGKLENLNLDSTFTTHFDKNQSLSIESIMTAEITAPTFGNSQGIQLYLVTFTNGNSSKYGSVWIETEAELTLDPKYCL